MKTPAVPLKLRFITATLEPQQVLCPYAAVTGRFYLRLRFLPSGSGATACGLFPRLAPTAVSLKADNPLPSPSRPLSEVYALQPSLSTANNVRLLFLSPECSVLAFRSTCLGPDKPLLGADSRKKSFFYKNCFMFLSCFPIDTFPVFFYSFACIPCGIERIDWRIGNG